MLDIHCDKCGCMIGPAKMQKGVSAGYSVNVSATAYHATNSSMAYLDEQPFEVGNRALCGKCLTKFNDYVGSFFNNGADIFGAMMEDKQTR